MRPTGKAKRPLDRRTPGTKGREQQPWPACSWGLPRPSDSGRSLRGQLQEDTHDLGGGTSSARLRSVRLTPGDYYGSQSVRSGHFCWSKWGKIGRVDTKRGVAYDRSTEAVCYWGDLGRPIGRTLAASCTTNRACVCLALFYHQLRVAAGISLNYG